MAIVNITVENDADFYCLFQYVTQNSDGSSGPPIDLTGCSLEMMLRRHAQDVEAVLRLGTDTGEMVLTDPTNGFFTVLISQPTLERLGLGSFDHSNIMTNGSSKTKIWSGTLINNAGPTR
jgi:hypothetical protein